MSDNDPQALEAFLRDLLSTEHSQVPQGGIRRIARTAKAAMGTGLSMLSGRFRGRSESGLAAADIQAIERLVRNLGELKGLAMKMGQIISYIDDSLSPEMRSLLGLLQTQSQPTRFEEVSAILTEDLGERFSELHLEPRPVSVASIGQVHRGTLPDGTAVAVKVRHPGILEALRSDFKMAGLGPLFASLLTPSGAGSVRGFIEEAKSRMLEECDFTLEAARQKRFAALYDDYPDVIIPRVHEAWSTGRVLTTTWEGGLSLEAFLASNPPQRRRDRVGEALFDFYFGTLYNHGLFHADPHPGNYAFREEGPVVFYDFGCAREFDRDTVEALSCLAHAVADDEEEAVRQAFTVLGGRIPKDQKAYDHVRSLLRSFFSPLLHPGRRRVDAKVNMAMGEAIRDKRMLLRLQLPGKLLFLFRIRFGLYAVLDRLQAESDWAARERALAST